MPANMTLPKTASAEQPRAQEEPRASDMEQIARWIKQHGRSARYAGKWVALIGERVLAEGDTYGELSERLEGHPERAESTIWRA